MLEDVDEMDNIFMCFQTQLIIMPNLQMQNLAEKFHSDRISGITLKNMLVNYSWVILQSYRNVICVNWTAHGNPQILLSATAFIQHMVMSTCVYRLDFEKPICSEFQALPWIRFLLWSVDVCPGPHTCPSWTTHMTETNKRSRLHHSRGSVSGTES